VLSLSLSPTAQVIVGALFKMRATALIHDVAHNTEEDMDKAAK